MSDVFNRIIPRLHQGGVIALERAGEFDVVVLCADEAQLNSPYAAPLRERFRGTVIECPLDDCDPIRSGDIERAEWAARIVADRVQMRRRVLVTCFMGLNRSGLVTGLVLRRLGYAPKDALRTVRAGRPWSLSNRAFATAVVAASKIRSNVSSTL